MKIKKRTPEEITSDDWFLLDLDAANMAEQWKIVHNQRRIL